MREEGTCNRELNISVMMAGDSPQCAEEPKILPSNNYVKLNEATVTVQPKPQEIHTMKAVNNSNADGVEMASPTPQNSLSIPECNSQVPIERTAFEMESASKEPSKCESCIDDCIYCTCQICDCTIL